ncbi:Zinc finger BED domain-containing protein 5 [Trichinella spiralis]|uniref:Zinc finger BED domain-containing protein 5 n=1 Tax=Trichinella spiralis TaxID=6334 RepID=A0A0V1AQA3_TRISP|nr:Zinc finger BED domain-containing protein 5 [Trichinella spiralis]
MDEWLIRKPVKRQLAEMESQQGSTAGDVNNKRKIDENESANFQLSNRRKVIRKYDIDYLKFGFTWNGDHKDPRPFCVIYYEILANESMRPNKQLRHIETKHMDLKSKPLQFFESKLKELNASQCVLSHFTNVNEKAMHASYLISLRIAQSGQPHTIGESLVLPSIKDAVGVMFGDTYLKKIELIPLSNDTLDESTDIQGLFQLIVFILFVWNSEPHEDILFCEPIIRGTSEEIYETLDAYVKSKELDWRNCVGICTDGARAMCGKNSGVVTRVLKQSPNATWTHCSIHREALVSKTISEDLKNVLNTAVKIINLIKSKPLESRLFEKLCEEMGSSHKSLLFHSEVRWLSRGKVLTRLVELREEVAVFLKGQSDYSKVLQDEKFVLKLTYLADIFSKLNELNLYLQRMDAADIFSVHDKIRDRNYCCFETLATFIVEKEATLDEDLISMIVVHLDSLKESFDYYFSEEMKFCDKNIWIVNPFQSDVVSTGISTKADEELIDLSEDSSFKMSFDRKRLIQFWLSVENTYPTLSTAALKVLLPFTTSYMCEIRFSAMIGIKTKLRNKLQISNNLRLKLAHISVDVEEVIIIPIFHFINFSHSKISTFQNAAGGAAQNWLTNKSIVYKAPGQVNGKIIVAGAAGNWQDGAGAINAANGHSFAKALEHVVGNDGTIKFLAYNNAPPRVPKVKTKSNSKGVIILSTNADAAAWIVHTVPGFPIPKTVYTWPAAETAKGHLLLCLTIPESQINAIAASLLFIQPMIHYNDIPETETAAMPYFGKLIKGEIPTLPPFTSRGSIRTENAGGPVTVHIYSKSESSKYVWSRRDNKLKGDCRVSQRHIRLITSPASVNGHNTNLELDETSWAVSDPRNIFCHIDKPYFKDQAKEPSLAVCIENNDIFARFND